VSRTAEAVDRGCRNWVRTFLRDTRCVITTKSSPEKWNVA
jgi:hypothetical protein